MFSKFLAGVDGKIPIFQIVLGVIIGAIAMFLYAKFMKPSFLYEGFSDSGTQSKKKIAKPKTESSEEVVGVIINDNHPVGQMSPSTVANVPNDFTPTFQMTEFVDIQNLGQNNKQSPIAEVEKLVFEDDEDRENAARMKMPDPNTLQSYEEVEDEEN